MLKFTDEDYQSGMGMRTQIWGPLMWSSLHMISFNYPVNPTDEQKTDYYNYIQSLTKILPCKMCRDNLHGNLKKLNFNKLHMKNRESFSRFIYDLHNTVNIMLGKSQYNKTYEEVRDEYENFRAKCDKTIGIEKGCVTPVNGIKSKCNINIVPDDGKGGSSFNIDYRCMYKSKYGGSKKKSKKTSKKTSKKKSKK